MQRRHILFAVTLATIFTMARSIGAQVQPIVPPVIAGAKAVAVKLIKIHGTVLEGNLEGDAVDRDVIVYLPPSYDSNAPTTFVPLHRYEWTAFGYATYDAVNGWQAFVTGNGIAGSDKGPTSVLPDWTLIVTP